MSSDSVFVKPVSNSIHNSHSTCHVLGCSQDRLTSWTSLPSHLQSEILLYPTLWMAFCPCATVRTVPLVCKTWWAHVRQRCLDEENRLEFCYEYKGSVPAQCRHNECERGTTAPYWYKPENYPRSPRFTASLVSKK